MSSKWDKFIFCAAAFVPSGREAIKLEGSAGSRARHMWREWGARRKGLATAQICASAFCAGTVLGKQEAYKIVEQISSNLSVLVRDSCGKGWSLAAPAPSPPPRLPVPPDQPSLPFTVPKRCKTDEKSTGKGSRCWDLRASVDLLMCAPSRPTLLPWRKKPTWEVLARNWLFFQMNAVDCVKSNIRPLPGILIFFFVFRQDA